jgi:competence protein ComFA
VTGAGKTEITFPLLEAALAAGGRALIATPRRDVVLELAPRLAKAFPADTPAVLYGGSEDRWSASNITLATTHQLMRFHQAFDLVIIDELDALPYITINTRLVKNNTLNGCRNELSFLAMCFIEWCV